MQSVQDFLAGVDWPHVLAVGIILVVGLAGVVMTLLTLPGPWVTLAAALGIKVWQPELFPWWVLIGVAGLAIAAEVIEFVAGALGATRAGATRRGAWGAIVGSIVGAIAGSPLLFPIGTIAGGVVGAAAGTLVMERGASDKTWKEASRAGAGAAVGRLVATLAKTAFAAAMALALGIAVFFK
jgi:uncharacterized protein